MKSRTAIVLMIFAITVLLSSVGFAQRMSVEERVKGLKDSLKLSDAQAAKITKLLEDQREEMTAAREENRGNPDGMRTVMQDMMKRTDEKIKGVLNEEQVKKYEAMMQARRANMGRRARGGGL